MCHLWYDIWLVRWKVLRTNGKQWHTASFAGLYVYQPWEFICTPLLCRRVRIQSVHTYRIVPWVFLDFLISNSVTGATYELFERTVDCAGWHSSLYCGATRFSGVQEKCHRADPVYIFFVFVLIHLQHLTQWNVVTLNMYSAACRVGKRYEWGVFKIRESSGKNS